MADNTKRDTLFANSAATPDVYLKLKLDADLYDTSTLTLVGGTETNVGDKDEIPTNKKYAVASGLVQLKKFKVSRGEGALRKTRIVELLVRRDLADTIDTTAKDQKLNLGRGATTVQWNIDDVV